MNVTQTTCVGSLVGFQFMDTTHMELIFMVLTSKQLGKNG